MAARGLADQKDPVLVDAIFHRMRMNPPDGAHCVLETGGRGRTSSQPVIDPHGKKTCFRPLPKIDHAIVGPPLFSVVRAGTPDPAPAVDRYDSRQGGGLVSFEGNVGNQGGTQDRSVHDVLGGDDGHGRTFHDGASDQQNSGRQTAGGTCCPYVATLVALAIEFQRASRSDADSLWRIDDPGRSAQLRYREEKREGWAGQWRWS
jgi:hypothetical protein